MAKTFPCGLPCGALVSTDSKGATVNKSFFVLRECADQYEAETIRIRLATDKIPVLITGTDPNVALSLGGAPTSRPVRVEVMRSDLERADTLLKQDHLRAKRDDTWICRRCHEQNESTFDVCWCCNKIHEEATANGRENLDSGNPEATGKPRTQVDQRSHQPQLKAETTSTRQQKSLIHKQPLITQTDQVEERQRESLSRCARSAVVGLLLFPPALNLYSIYLLLNLEPTVYRNADTRLRVLSIWIFNAAVVSLGTTLWWLLFFR